MPQFETLAAHLADRYRLERKLGSGGFATVYLAHDLRHDRPVALKVLHDDIAASLSAERFEREIKFAARLQHPHILGVFDSEMTAGRLWFTMPFVEGESLRDRITREKQLPLGEAVSIAREVADALHYAHQRDILHRDIKPENILLSGKHAVVADFGIARALSEGESNGSLTRTGTSIGTAGYMSPEQAMGERGLDARTDVYALACVLYEMLAGEPPITGPNMQTVIARTISETPRSLHVTRPSVSEALDGVVQRGLSKLPADRYPTAEAFGEALDAVIANMTASSARSATASVAVLTPRTISANVSAGSSASASTESVTKQTGRRTNMFAMFAIGLLIGVGALFAWRYRTSADSGVHAVAVIPFDNVGDVADAYFADGITEEVRGKLTSVPSLRVTARATSNQYRGGKKSPKEVGEELGVEYILTGTVRWETDATGQRHVRVSPELINTSNGSAKWQDSYDEVISDVFRMQTSIAQRVAENLGVTLGADLQASMAGHPTQNVAAYQEFLLGEKETESMSRADNVSFRKGLEHYERATALDTTFGVAWARVSQSYTEFFATNSTDELASSAESALRKAERYAQGDPITRRAASRYLRIVKTDYEGAFAQIDSGLKTQPNNVDLLSTASTLAAVLGRWDAATDYGKRAFTLDPRSVTAASVYGRILHGVRKYAEADEIYRKALTLSPRNLTTFFSLAVNYVSMGDLPAAQRVTREGLAVNDTTEYAAYFALYQEMMWLLDPPILKRITQMSPAPFANNRQQWALKVGRTWLLLGDTAKGRAYGDTSRVAAEAQLASFPENAQLHELRGRALALMGRNSEAIEEAERSFKMRESTLDKTTGPYVRYQIARILVQAGAYDRALDILETSVVENYSDLTPAWLKLEPTFRPLSGNVRFERLTGGK